MSTTPEHRRARRLAATMTVRTVRRTDGDLIAGAELVLVGDLDLDDVLAEAGTAGLVLEDWTKTASTHLELDRIADDEDPPTDLDDVDDRILQAIGVDPMPAGDLAEGLGIDDGTVRGRLQALRDAGLVATAGNRGWRLA